MLSSSNSGGRGWSGPSSRNATARNSATRTAAAAVETLDARNRKAQMVGINGSKEAVELIKSGKMLASGEFNGFVIGCLATEIAARILL